MDRLFTAFVSSTYLDLARERALVANSLLMQDCVPLGMEFFPSTGASQWKPILESISAADFCIFIVAGRYGSLVPSQSISWTHREFREVHAQGKPLIALLHSDIAQLRAASVEFDEEKRDALLRFRSELESICTCRYFRDDAELLTGLHASIASLKRDRQIDGWIPAGKRPVFVQETDFNMTYELIEVQQVLRLSDVDSSRMDVNYTGRRVLIGNQESGVSRIVQDFSRANEALGFNEANQPILALTNVSRSRVGSIRLAAPRRTIGSIFAQDITFSPPLGVNEMADFTIEGVLPRYRLRFAEDLLAATHNTGLGARGYDFASRSVMYPNKLLVIRVFIPDTGGLTPAGPRVGTATKIDDAASVSLVASGYYSEWSASEGGVSGTFAELRVPSPQYHRTYRVAWNLPSR